MSGITNGGIRYPDGATKAKNLGPELKTMAEDLDKYVEQQASTTDTGLANKIRQPGSATRGALGEIMPDMVEVAVAGSAAVQEGATTAVVKAVADLELVQAGVLSRRDELGIALAFEDGSRSALEVDTSGRPTSLAARLHVEAEAELMGAALGVETRTDIALDNVAALWVFEDDSIAATMYTDGSSTFGGGAPPAVSVWPAVAVGDSTTAGADLVNPAADRWSTLLSSLVGHPITNRGLSGSRAEEITARLTSLTISGVVDGGVIPASGQVAISGLDIDPWRAGNAAPYEVDALTDDGQRVRGVLSRVTASDRMFTLTEPGEAIPTDRLELRATATDRRQLLFLGQGINNEPQITAGAQTIDQVLSWYRAATTGWLGPLVIWGMLDRGPVEGVGTPHGTIIHAVNTWIAQQYGEAFCDVRSYLASPQALEDATRFDPGFVPTEYDLGAQAVGTCPPSFRVTFQTVHLNPLGHQLQARFMHRHLLMRGLI